VRSINSALAGPDLPAYAAARIAAGFPTASNPSPSRTPR
jgi:hypothetical protein